MRDRSRSNREPFLGLIGEVSLLGDSSCFGVRNGPCLEKETVLKFLS